MKKYNQFYHVIVLDEKGLRRVLAFLFQLLPQIPPSFVVA